jgi:peptidoglycan/LPS O-acetylase OafA/YrhL
MKNDRRERIPGYLYALDGLRAVSLIFIVMFHTWQQSWIFCNLKLTQNHMLFNFEIIQRYGYVAIDSFFVLSGFCLFYPIARDMFGESKFTGWKQFFIKRARRIYPSYALMLILLLIFPALSYSVYNTSSAADVAKHFLSHLFFIHNFSSATLGSTISTAWTMSVEVQFYLLFPLICIPFRKKPVLTFIAMAAVGLGLRLTLLCTMNISPAIISAITPIYFDVFGFGMIAAYFVVYMRNSGINLKRLRPCMTVLSALCLFTAVCYIYWLKGAKFPQGCSSDVYFRFLYRGIFSMLLAGFIFTACFSYEFWEKKIWGNRFFVFLSSISYTVYLWHQNIYIFLKSKNIPYATQNPVMNDRQAMEGMVFICLTASIIIGVLVTRYIEAPVVKYGFKGCFVKIAEKLHLTEPVPKKNTKHTYSNKKHKRM